MISFVKWAENQIKNNKNIKPGDWDKYKNKIKSGKVQEPEGAQKLSIKKLQ